MTEHTKPQPAPTSSEHPDVLDAVLEALPGWQAGDSAHISSIACDLIERAKDGQIKYGTRLKPHNGRDALIDAYQEALDLVMYLQQSIMEQPAPGMELLFGQACVMASSLRARIASPHPPDVPKYCYSDNEESFEGSYASRDEALADAIDCIYEWDDDGFATVWTGRCVPIEETIPDACTGLAERLLETLNEWMHDEVVGGDEDVVDLQPKQIVILDKLVAGYLLEHAQINRWCVREIQEHRAPATADGEDG